MSKENKTSFKQKLTNFFGGIGYLGCIIGWIWVVLLYFEPIKDLIKTTIPDKTAPVIQDTIASSPKDDPLKMIAMIIITALILGLTIWVVTKLPSYIAKQSKKIVHEVAENTAPLITKSTNQPEEKKKRTKLTFQIIIVIKIIVTILPIAFVYFSKSLEKPMIDHGVALIISAALAGICLFWFALEYLLAKIFKIKLSEIW